MTSERKSRELRIAARPPAPIPVTKRLVAHAAFTWQRSRSRPYDGDPVFLPAPCERLRAGYWCDCGEGFGRDLDEIAEDCVSQARVEPCPSGVGTRFLEDRVRTGWEHGRATEEEQLALQAQIESLPIGTVVERFGTGIAIRFQDDRYPPTSVPMRA